MSRCVWKTIRYSPTGQHAAGIELRDDVPRTDEDRERALLVGGLHLVQLAMQRSSAKIGGNEQLWSHTARAVSRLRDTAAPPGRPGRWLPDPTVPLLFAGPVDDPAAVNEDEQARQWLDLLTALLELDTDTPASLLALCRRIAQDPRPVDDQLAVLNATDSDEPSLLEVLAQHVDAGAVLIEQLMVPEWTALDPQRFEVTWNRWLDTGTTVVQWCSRYSDAPAAGGNP